MPSEFKTPAPSAPRAPKRAAGALGAHKFNSRNKSTITHDINNQKKMQKGGQIVIGNVLSPGENRSGIPDHVIESLARCFLPDLIAFFESDEGKREYEEWERNQGNVSDINVA